MNYKRKLYQELASAVQARQTCEQVGNQEWFAKHTANINSLVANFMPSGSGWDGGTKIDLDASTGEKLVFSGAFHHMDENGFYDGWTEHTITVKASLVFTLDIKVSGRNRNDIKEHLAEMFSYDLTRDIDYDAVESRWKLVA